MVELKSIPSCNASISIKAFVELDKVRFAFSQAVRKRRRARLLEDKSFPLFFFLNSFIKYLTILESKSSPPR